MERTGESEESNNLTVKYTSQMTFISACYSFNHLFLCFSGSCYVSVVTNSKLTPTSKCMNVIANKVATALFHTRALYRALRHYSLTLLNQRLALSVPPGTEHLEHSNTGTS